MVELSVVMPAYNEGHLVRDAISRVENIVEQMDISYEIIVVDDGSKDDTRKRVVDSAKGNGRVRIISYEKNMGKGHAIRTGFQQAAGRAVVLIDSDLDVDARHIPGYLDALREADVAIGSKWHPESSVEMPLIRKLASHGFSLIVELLTDLKLRDTQTGLKGIRKNSVTERIFSELSVDRYAYDVEFLVLANLHGLTIKELPVKIRMNSMFDAGAASRMFFDVFGIARKLKGSGYDLSCLKDHRGSAESIAKRNS